MAVILIDFALKEDENYYPQVFLKESKYIEKEKKLIRHITVDLKISSVDPHRESIKTKYPVRYLLTRMHKIVRPQKVFIRIFLAF